MTHDTKTRTYKIEITEPEALKFMNVDRWFDEQAKDIFISLLGFNIYRGKYNLVENIRYFSDGYFCAEKDTTHIETDIRF